MTLVNTRHMRSRERTFYRENRDNRPPAAATAWRERISREMRRRRRRFDCVYVRLSRYRRRAPATSSSTRYSNGFCFFTNVRIFGVRTVSVRVAYRKSGASFRLPVRAGSWFHTVFTRVREFFFLVKTERSVGRTTVFIYFFSETALRVVNSQTFTFSFVTP